MQAAERHNVATRVTEKLAETNSDFGLHAFGGAVRSRIETALTAIDAAAVAANAPLLVIELMVGVDLIVACESSDVSRVQSGAAPRLDAVWDRDDMHVEWLGPLTELVISILRAGTAQGAYYHRSADAMHYFLFESKYRSEALKQFGMNDDEVFMVEAPAEVA